jgi:hypothetical protein
MVVLILAMQCELTPTRVRQLQELVGVSRCTVARWRDWWRSVFTESSFWRAQVDGKDLSALSAGERGGLLLIFYLMHGTHQRRRCTVLGLIPLRRCSLASS